MVAPDRGCAIALTALLGVLLFLIVSERHRARDARESVARVSTQLRDITAEQAKVDALIESREAKFDASIESRDTKFKRRLVEEQKEHDRAIGGKQRRIKELEDDIKRLEEKKLRG